MQHQQEQEPQQLLAALASLVQGVPTPFSPVRPDPDMEEEVYYAVSPTVQQQQYRYDPQSGAVVDQDDISSERLKELLGEWQAAYKKMEAERNHWYIQVCKLRRKN